jgi:hypothetical protein
MITTTVQGGAEHDSEAGGGMMKGYGLPTAVVTLLTGGAIIAGFLTQSWLPR